ncbi:hypothetical protein SERLA73DRAFT_175870 [Serpula lacrymans var. lacrymans S7.3]|uniref:RlpA-like protein double-psi beta-barrel domain-containing protein n=1 Tax=Serpula lacrymans var. lacrymans (strain S7.3) TaxID=936435 RepID=F8PJH1_SERL3|nr:hypothetical protein SERLA73DRAFT_175870 [Serpula lacrymans var. lacrymans S7.3]
MSSFKKCLVLFYLALSATALTTPHFSRNAFNHHRAVAAHAQSPAPVVDQAIAIPAQASSSGRRKRSLNKRCVARSSSSSSSSSTSASPAPSSSVAPINVAPSPSIASSSSSVAAPTTSSPVAQPTSSPAPAPQTTSTPAPPPPTTTSTPPPPATTATPTSSAAPVQTSAGEPSFLIGTQTGEGTYYATGLGACGITNTDTDYIAAVSHLLFDVFPGYNGVNPNDNPVCNQKVTANYQGKSVTVTITDRCTGCAITDLDFSPSAFSQLADQSIGRIDGMTWVWDSI